MYTDQLQRINAMNMVKDFRSNEYLYKNTLVLNLVNVFLSKHSSSLDGFLSRSFNINAAIFVDTFKS